MRLVALLLIATTTAAAAAAALRLHVDPARGSDDGNGDESQPLASIRAAQLALRGRAIGEHDAATSDFAEVVLRRGTHRVPPGGLRFDARDSGARYRAEPGAVVTGGRRLVGWEQVSVNGTDDLWRVALPVANLTRQLYAFGARARRASMQWQPSWTAGLVDLTSQGYIFKERQAWMESPDVQQLEFVYTGDTSVWTECRCAVQTVTQLSDGTVDVTMRQPCWANGWKGGRKAKQGIKSPPTSIENSRTALAAPGDWVHAADGYVYYWPRSGEDMSADPDTSIPVEEVLLSVNGSSDLHWDGVTFEMAGWTLPSSGVGYIEVQSGSIYTSASQTGGQTLTPGAIRVSHGRDLSFTSCTFRHLGATGLQVRAAMTCSTFVLQRHCPQRLADA